MIRRDLESESKAAGGEASILAFCEECGRASKFPDALRGRVVECLHCGRFMDVIESEGNSLDDEIAVREYVSPNIVVSRRFKWLFVIMLVTVLGLVVAVQIVQQFVHASFDGAGGPMQP